MKICLLLGPMSLGPRTDYPFASWRQTPGLTGTDQGFIRIGECLAAAGHSVEYIVPSSATEHAGCKVVPRATGHYDAALAVNEPDLLRYIDADIRACAMWLNDVSFCRVGFNRSVDLFFSPSNAHREQFRTRPAWRRVEVTQQNPNGIEQYEFEPDKWRVVHLGCDPDRFGTHAPGTADESPQWVPIAPKVPGKVVYCSSPDRGLHHLLSQWPRIRRAVPHATLHIFYRLGQWIQDVASAPYPFPPIEALRARALYINEALGRMTSRPNRMGITIHDSVSRETIEREMASAECLAYPCDTVRWSEGFSCTILEACAARSCPVVLETDALPDVYGGTVPMVGRLAVNEWADEVIRVLTDPERRAAVNERCGALASKLTWAATAQNMIAEIAAEMARKREAA